MPLNRFWSLLVLCSVLKGVALAGSASRNLMPNVLMFQTFSVRPSGTIDLGPSAVGVNTPHAFPVPIIVQNLGTADLNITPSFTGDFAFTAESLFNFPITLTPGGSKEGDILFTPQAAGVRTGQFVSTDNAPGSPHMVPLTGVGVPVPNNDFGIVADANIISVPSGKTTTFKIWVLAGPGLPVGPDGTLQCSGGPGGTSCNLASNAFSIESGGFGNTRDGIPVTVTVPAQTGSLGSRPPIFWWSVPTALGIVLTCKRRKPAAAAAVLSVALLSGFIVSCGGSGGSGTHALLFTASRNGVTHTLSLPVQ